MTGLLLLGVVAIWLVAAVGISVFIFRKLPKRGWRLPLVVIFFPVLICLPLLDEIVGKLQFNALCKQYAVQYIDEQHVRDRSVRFIHHSEDAKWTAVRIRIRSHEFKDTDTQKVVVRYHTVHANGGLLIRTLGISESDHPLIFNAACGPKDQDGFKKKFNVTVVN